MPVTPVVFLTMVGVLLIKGMQISITSYTCAHNPKLISWQICTVTRGRLLNHGCIFDNPTDEITGQMILYRKYGNKYQKYLIDISDNMCDIFSDKTYTSMVIGRLLDLGPKMLRQLRCPLQGNITVERFPFILNFVPFVFPAADYAFFGTTKSFDDFLFSMNLTFSVRNSKKY